MGRAAVPLDTIWPDGADPKTLVCVRVQCSAADLFNLLFVERDLSEQLHKQRADTDLAETSWMATKDQLPAQLYTWDAESTLNQPSTTLRYRKVRFESPPTALASKPFQNEETQVVTELFPDTLYVLEAVSSTSAPYGDKFNVFFRYVVRADGPATSALHLLFHVEFLPSMNRMMRPMVGKAIDAGVRGTFRIFRSVLGAARPCTDIKEGDLPAGPPAVYHEHVPESEEAAEGPEVARAHAPHPPHHPPLAAPGAPGPGGPNLLSVLTQQLLYKDQVVLLADLAGAGLRSLTHSDAGAQLLAALLTVWLISLAVRALRGWQALCAPAPPGGAPAGGLVFLARLGVCWPLRLVDVPESTAEVLVSLALVAAINWAVISAAQATVRYLSQANPALLASLRQGGDGGGGGGGGGAAFGGVPFGQQAPSPASPGQGSNASGGGAGEDGGMAAASPPGSASMSRAPSSASHGGIGGGGSGRGQGKDGSKRGSGGGGGSAAAAPVSGAAAGASTGGKAPAAASAAAAKPSKPMRAAPAPKQFTAAQLKQLELGVVTSGKKSSNGAAVAAAEPSASASGASAARAPSPPPKTTPQKAAAKEAPVHAMAAMTDAWAADLPAGMVAPADSVKRTAVSPQRGASTSGTPAATAPLAASPVGKAAATKPLEGSAPGTAVNGGGGDGAGPPSVAAAPPPVGTSLPAHPTAAAPPAVPPAAASASASITTSSFANMFTKEGIDSMAESLRSAFRWDAKPTDASEQAESALATPEPSASPSATALAKSKVRSEAGALTSAADAAGRPAGFRHNPAAGASARSFGGVSGGVPYFGTALPGAVSLCSAHSDWPLLPHSDAEEEDGGEPTVVVEEVFENERFQPFRGWGHMWPGHFLPSDRVGHWSDRQGKPGGSSSMVFEQVVPQLPPGWRWLEDDWQVDVEGLDSEAVDPDGWTYALDFYLLKYPPPPQGGKCSLKHFVRRRRYYRTRILADEAGGDDQDDYGEGSFQPAEEPPGSVALKPLTGSPPREQVLTLAQAADHAPEDPTAAALASGAAQEGALGTAAAAAAAAKGRDSGTAAGGGHFTAPDAVLSLSEALAEQPPSATEGAARALPAPGGTASGGGGVSEGSSVELRPPHGRAAAGPGAEAGGEEGGGSGRMSTGGAGGSSARGGAEGEESGLGPGGGSSGSEGEAFVLSPKTVMTGRDPLGALPGGSQAGAERPVAGALAAAPEPAAAPAAAAEAVAAPAGSGVSTSGVGGGSGSRIGHGGEGLVASAVDGPAQDSASGGEAPPPPQGRGPAGVGGQVGEVPQVGALGSGAQKPVQSAGADGGRTGAGGGGGLVGGAGEVGSAGSPASQPVSDDLGGIPAE